MQTRDSFGSEARRLIGGVAYLRDTGGPQFPSSGWNRVEMPLAGVSYEAYPDGLIADARKLFGLDRLGGESRRYIRQLQFLTAVRTTSAELREASTPHTFSHTRWEHGLGAAALMDLMLADHPDPALRKLGVLLGVMHDVQTTAGGDAVKSLFRDNEQLSLLADEDAQFAHAFRLRQKAWKEFCARHALPASEAQRLLVEGIRGYGLLGDLLNIADTASYLALDVQFLREAVRNNPNSWVHTTTEGRSLIQLVEMYAAGRIWASVDIHGERAVIRDHGVLTSFLHLRVMMWMQLYQHPEAKFLELLFVQLLAPDLLRRRLMDIKRLMRWDDHRLAHLIAQEFGESIFTNLLFLERAPVCRLHASREGALAHEREAFDRGAFTLFVPLKTLPRTKSKADRYWVQQGGRIQTYADAFPLAASRLSDMANAADWWTQFAVYTIEGGSSSSLMTNALRTAWQEARRTW